MWDKADGIYVVIRRDAALELREFYSILRPEDDIPVKSIMAKNFPRGPQYGDDGIEVDLRPGALVKFTHKPEVAKFGFHMQNVEPMDDISKLQYAFILGKLGLGRLTKLPTAYLAAEGQFRKLCKDIAAGKETKN